MEKKRKLYESIKNALLKGEHNTVLLLGLRKTGKTTLLTQIAEEFGKDAVYYVDCRDVKLTMESYYDLFELPQKYILIDELGYFPEFDQYMKNLQQDIGSTGKKFVLTSSSYGLMKQLAHEKLGGRACVLELFPLSFEEYLYFSGKISAYGENYEPADMDLQDFYRLRGVPGGMDFLIDTQYMLGVFNDVQNGLDNQLGTVRDIELERKHYMAITDLIAYTLNSKISMRRFKGMQIGVQEFGKAVKGLKLSESLIGLANKTAMGLDVTDIAKIIAYLYRNGFLFVDLEVNEEASQKPDSLIGDLLAVKSESNLSAILREYTFSVISPLLYTRLMVDLESIADKLCASNALYGELYELTMKSESVYKQGYSIFHTSYKYKRGDMEVDLVEFGISQGLLIELTISHKQNKDHYADKVYRGKPFKRILTDVEGVYEKDGDVMRIGYPKALLMMSEGINSGAII